MFFRTFLTMILSISSTAGGWIQLLTFLSIPIPLSLTLQLSGLKKDDFKIQLDNNILTISSEVKDEKEEEEKNYTRKEFHYSSFSRSFTLPRIVNLEKIKADYENGILKVILPKKDEAKVEIKKEIKIS